MGTTSDTSLPTSMRTKKKNSTGKGAKKEEDSFNEKDGLLGHNVLDDVRAIAEEGREAEKVDYLLGSSKFRGRDDIHSQRGRTERLESENLRSELRSLRSELEEIRHEMRKSAMEGGSTKNKRFMSQESSPQPRNGNDSEVSSMESWKDEEQGEKGVNQSAHLETHELPEDTYGMITCSKMCRWGWSFGVLVSFIQIGLFAFFVNNIVNYENKENPFGVPADVETVVRITQVIAVLISVFVQDDLRMAVELGAHRAMPHFCLGPKEPSSQEQNGPGIPDSPSFEDTREANHSSSEGDNEPSTSGSSEAVNEEGGKANTIFRKIFYAQWYHSVIIRGVEGFLSLFASYVLIVQSDNVFDLLLNFTAAMFISELDDIAYGLAKRAYFGGSIKEDAEAVEGRTYTYISGARGRKYFGKYYKNIMLVTILLLMYCAFAFQTSMQESMQYFTCQEDRKIPVLYFFGQ